MTVPTPGPVPVPTECTSCTVPTAAGGLCSFCQTYTPPATPSQQVDVLVNKVDLVRRGGNALLRELPSTTPLFACVDLVTALDHLRLAAVALDRAADQLEAADAKAGAR